MRLSVLSTIGFGTMTDELIAIREATREDANALADIYKEAWQLAYRGILPHLDLERMIASRSGRWWYCALSKASNVLIMEFDGAVIGYANFGRNRVPSLPFGGEIHELYLKPAYQGVGLGKQLFQAAHKKLKSQGVVGLIVWALADNRAACEFYTNMGGKFIASDKTRFGKQFFKKNAFAWST